MSQMIYIKYNSLRRPEYRVSTEIREADDGTRVVIKRPMNKASKLQIDTIKSNYDKLANLYSHIAVIPYSEEGDGVSFPFISGESLLHGFDMQHKKSDEIFGKLDELMKVIYDYKITAEPFTMTDKFAEVFPGIEISEPELALPVINVDSNIDNFLSSEGKIWCIDYEWVFDFPVPVRYVKFRTLLYFYAKQNAFIADKISVQDYYEHYGFSADDVKLFTAMEDCFQQYVHGENRKYIVTSRYEKAHKSFAEINELATKLPEEIKLKDEHIGNLTQVIENDKSLLAEKDSHIGNLNAIIKTDDEAIKSLRSDVDKLNDSIKEQTEAIKKQAEAIEKQNATIRHQNENVRLLNDTIEHDKATIDSKDTHIGNLEAIIANRKATIDSKDTHIGNLEAIIANREEQLGQRDAYIAERDAYIAEIMHAIKNPFYGMYLVGKKVKSKLTKHSAANATVTADKAPLQNNSADNDDIQAPVNDYETWITRLEAEQTYDDKFEYTPKISVIVPVYNVLDKHLVPCIESVLNQIYPNFELCMADDCSTWDNVKATLKRYEDNPKVKICYRTENGHISKSTNSAIELATGEFIAFLDCDDTLSPNALYEVVKELNKNPKLDFIYSDEDKVDDDGNNRHMPHFKPDWSPDTLMSNMYTCHLGVYRTSIAKELGGLRAGYEGSQDYDFALRFTENLTRDHIAHIPKILYHWLERKESTSVNPESKPYILEAARKAKSDAVERRGLEADIELVDIMYQWRVNYKVQGNPKVSIIIPSKDNYEIIKRCLDSVKSLTEYNNYEIIVVDNGSSEENKARYEALISNIGGQYIYQPEPFNFPHMCNTGAARSSGEYYLFLNDDTEVLSGDWISRMLGHAQVPYTGAVGAKLLYPESDKIQHCGVINIGNGPVHAFGGMTDEYTYYFGRNRIDFNWLAVTAACLMVCADKFAEVAGFNEDLAVAYNDVDFCFKLYEAGYYNVVRNDVILKHYESVSRGDDRVDEAKMARLDNERAKLYALHPEYSYTDPLYNINLNQHANDFSINEQLTKY